MRSLRILVFAALLAGASCASEPTDAEKAARMEDFEQSMRNVVLEGHFTVTGRGDGTRLRAERYEIEKFVHVAGDLWTVHARVQYGDHDFTAPIPVQILWAGDTPVISLTDVEVPGAGSFTARVVFYNDHYSGMWWHGETGGNQFGRILRDQPQGEQ